MESKGNCNYCKKPIPATRPDQTPTKEGIDYKEVLGDPETKWHHADSRFQDCFELEANDPTSSWYDDPRRYLDELEEDYRERDED